MNDWLFDLGNSRLKFAPRRQAAVVEMRGLAHWPGEDFASLPDEVRGETAWVAAVVAPALRAALAGALAERFARVSFVRSTARCGRLRVAYAEPARLGVDRFLALLAAAEAGRPVLVAGVGTALTVDLVDETGGHRGGRIAPSPTLMRESLHARVAQLPAAGGHYAEFAADTGDALASGCEGAALALIERSLAEAGTLLGRRPALWLHGGGGGVLLARLAAAESRPRLVLDGLARWAALADRA
ncbi:type III pantothenate kinase [Lysobacter pythonis]|uniref:Type III pantothenate kinase n=1 Tax=Solilutibacter pythonis TaxID=2483112 RepID=A0A3M2I0F8_9GAMM|nr:type III pantothenate kinase [Lysobacter pythonis]RMH93390.1 type III pantothenate kinase [Lysobacter pythonis]